jgi:predicted RNase H-like HicB family nuclease
MRYSIAIEPGDAEHAFGVVVPDLPGCFSAGDTLDSAIDNAREAINLWLETAIDDGASIPEARPISEHYNDPELAGWIWAVIEVDLATLSDKTERINITLPSRILRRIDKAAQEAGESRSGFIARRMLAS